MAAADAWAALFRSRVAARALLHAAQAVALVVLLRALAEVPWVAAAGPSILRFAKFFLVPQRLGFLFVNIIVIAIATLFPIPSDAASSSPTTFFADASSGSPSTNSNGDAPKQHPLLEFLDASRTQTSMAEEEPSGEEVFEDKHAVHVKKKKKVRAQPPRRTVSEKTTTGGAAAAAVRTATAAPPELRRAKSENGKRRQRRSEAVAAAAEPAPVELVTDNEAFRQLIEAFITKQQTLFREESLVYYSRATAAGAGGEDGPALAGGAAAVAVK